MRFVIFGILLGGIAAVICGKCKDSYEAGVDHICPARIPLEVENFLGDFEEWLTRSDGKRAILLARFERFYANRSHGQSETA